MRVQIAVCDGGQGIANFGAIATEVLHLIANWCMLNTCKVPP
jgi:hypothetical protein